MTYPYLDKLPLNDAQKQAITDAEYENAPTLYIMCKFIPTAMKQVLGVASLDELETALWQQLDEVERAEVQQELDDLKNL